MSEERRWSRLQVKCRETERKTNLLVEWGKKDGKDFVNGITCDNPELADYGGRECEWSCWDEVSGKKKRA